MRGGNHFVERREARRDRAYAIAKATGLLAIRSALRIKARPWIRHRQLRDKRHAAFGQRPETPFVPSLVEPGEPVVTADAGEGAPPQSLPSWDEGLPRREAWGARGVLGAETSELRPRRPA